MCWYRGIANVGVRIKYLLETETLWAECAAVFNKQVGSSLINKEPGLSQPQPLLILIIYTELGSLGQRMSKSSQHIAALWNQIKHIKI